MVAKFIEFAILNVVQIGSNDYCKCEYFAGSLDLSIQYGSQIHFPPHSFL